MWARIENNVVAEVTDIDPAGRFHPSMIWVACTTDVQPNWVYDGENFSPPAPLQEVVQVPHQVSRAQGKAALIQAGLWQGVLDYVASIEDATQKAIAEVALNDTTYWQRTSPFLNAAATALGLTQEQLDDLFVTASEIEL